MEYGRSLKVNLSDYDLVCEHLGWHNVSFCMGKLFQGIYVLD